MKGQRIILLLFFMIGVAKLQPQSAGRWLKPDTVKPIQRSYHVDSTEFTIDLWQFSSPVERKNYSSLSGYYQAIKDSIKNIWKIADTLGANILSVGVWSDEEISELDSLNSNRGNGKLSIQGYGFSNYSCGREIEFYPFKQDNGLDTAQSDYYKNVFRNIVGGSDTFNIQEADTIIDGNSRIVDAPREKIYRNSSDIGIVSDSIEFDIGRMSEAIESRNSYFVRSGRGSIYPENRKFYISLKAHLIDRDAAADTTKVLRVYVYHRVPQGRYYLNPNGSTAQANTQKLFLIKSFYVTHGELVEGIDQNVHINKYRTKELEFRTDSLGEDGHAGMQDMRIEGLPNRGDLSQMLEIKVEWTGAEAVALRSVAIRDWLGQQALGKRAENRLYQNELETNLRKILYRDPTNKQGLRSGIFRVSSCDEPTFNRSEFAGHAKFDRTLKKLVHNNTGIIGDSLPLYVAQPYQRDVWHRNLHSLVNLPELVLELYPIQSRVEYKYEDVGITAKDMENLDKTSADSSYKQLGDMFRMPRIKEHNINVTGIPSIKLTPAGIEALESCYQKVVIGTILPNENDENWMITGSYSNQLWHGARIAREFGKRLCPLIGTSTDISYQYKGNNAELTVGHLPEASELRLAANMSLCYGSRGGGFFGVGNQNNIVVPFKRVEKRPVKQMRNGVMVIEDQDVNIYDTTKLSIYHDTWGSSGFYYQDLYDDTLSMEYRNNWLTLNYWDSSDSTIKTKYYVPDELKLKLPRMYVGYKNRIEELKYIGKNLYGIVGKKMLDIGLRWRDSYSIHGQTEHPEISGYTARRLDKREIITEVKSYGPQEYMNGGYSERRYDKEDQPDRTFVELGLFYTKDYNGYKQDTNYVYVVNRRTFERPQDISPTSEDGKKMDTLAEARLIKLRLNMPENPIDYVNQELATYRI